MNAPQPPGDRRDDPPGDRCEEAPGDRRDEAPDEREGAPPAPPPQFSLASGKDAAGVQGTSSLPLGPGERELLGVVRSVLFSNPDSGYAVLSLQVRGNPLPVTVTGSLHGIDAGATIRAAGTFKEHARFGRQFQVSRFEELRPRLPEGMKRYLSSRLEGVGAKLAERIVDHFGERAYEILDADPGRFAEVEGIGPRKAKNLAEQWHAKRALREVDTFLQQYGISPGQVGRLFRQYGDAVIALVKSNPYRLADEVRGIGFRTADKIAENLGFAKDSIERARAALQYVLNEAAGEGHLMLPRERLLQAAEALEVAPERAGEALEALLAERLLIEDPLAAPGPEATAVFLPRHHEDERAVAALLRLRMEEAKPWPGAADRLKGAARQAGLALAPEQEAAVRQALEAGVSVITGGPGVGKTTIVRLLVDVLRQARADVKLAAPTGRAAKRLSDATGMEAATIHRLLKFDPFRNVFTQDERTPLEADHLVVDECSMVDVPLAASLLRALKEGARLTLVGDADQLPSVGPGAFFRDVCTAGTLPVTRLTRVFRQREGSRIVLGAHAVNRGEFPEFDPPGRGGEFFFVERDVPDAVAETIRTLVAERIPRAYGLDPRADVQVLTPMHKGSAGAENLNEILGRALNPNPPAHVERKGRVLRVGDRVVQVKNDYERNVFNGDQGVVRHVDAARSVVAVQVDDRQVEYPFDQLDVLLPAWATTVHRAQGGEHKAVVLALTNQHFPMLRRNLVYTAITRARQLCVIVGSRRALQTAIQNGSEQDRFSLLHARLAAPDPGSA